MWNDVFLLAFSEEKSTDRLRQLPLVKVDESDKVEAWLDPSNEFPPSGSVEISVRLRNKSDHAIYGPMTVEIVQYCGNPCWALPKYGVPGKNIHRQYGTCRLSKVHAPMFRSALFIG